MFDRKTLAQWQDALEAYDRGELTQEDLDELLARRRGAPRVMAGRPMSQAEALGDRVELTPLRRSEDEVEPVEDEDATEDEWLIDPRYG